MKGYAAILLRPKDFKTSQNWKTAQGGAIHITFIGHLLSGRYKAQLVEGSGTAYLRTACDYVHLNPARAGLLKSGERLLAYP